jgi:hypothetical protein
MRWITREHPKIDRVACPWLYPNDEELLPHAFLLYDALYEWLQHAKSERHSWNPQRVPTPA